MYAGTDVEPQLKTLVRISLLFNQHTRFHFHQLIREYFLQKSGAGKRCGDLMQNFKSEFLQYFAEYLKSMLEMTRVSDEISTDMNSRTHYNSDWERYRPIYITKK